MNYENSEQDKAAHQVGGRWAVYDQIDGLDGGGYMDPSHPRVQAVARRVLGESLKAASEQAESFDGLWHVFRDFVRAHEYAEVIAGKVKMVRAELVEAIREDAQAELRAEALKQVYKQMRQEVGEKIRAELTEELHPILEADVRQQLIQHFNRTQRDKVIQELRDNLRRSLRDEVRIELHNDPEIQAAAISDLKRRITGL